VDVAFSNAHFSPTELARDRKEQLSSSPTCSASQKFIFANSAASIRLGASISIERWQISSTGKSAGFFPFKTRSTRMPAHGDRNR